MGRLLYYGGKKLSGRKHYGNRDLLQRRPQGGEGGLGFLPGSAWNELRREALDKLLEKRSDSDVWGLVGGGCKKWETGRQAIVREVYEELGLRIAPERFRKLAVYDNPGRIAAFRDGSIWRMVIVVYALELEEEPEMHISRESKDLRFFSREEIGNIEIAITHRDIVEDWFVKAICE